MAKPASDKAPVDRSDYEGLQLDTRARDETEKDYDPLQDYYSSIHGGTYNSTQNGTYDITHNRTYSSIHHSTHHSIHNSTHSNPSSPERYRGGLGWTDEKAFMTQTEAEAQAAQQSAEQRTATQSHSTASSAVPIVAERPVNLGVPPQPEVQRICGLQRKWFWLVFIPILVLVITAAVIGGVLGAMKINSATPSPPAVNTTITPSPVSGPAPGSSNPFLPKSDVMVDSPLAPVSFVNNSQQSYRLYFQSAHGNVKESLCDGTSAPWHDTAPILTDALNNTGIAALTYLNGTKPQTSVFYVGANRFLQEKRNYPGAPFFEPGPLNALNRQAFGNISISDFDTQQDPSNSWYSYRMAAVYSVDFYSGPGARLFYHVQGADGRPSLQELIWTQKNDSWSVGTLLSNVAADSHLAATIDRSTKTLRLYYSPGNLALNELWLDITKPDAGYKTGVQIPSLLAHNSADLAAVSTENATFLYYWASSGVLSIRELTITGFPPTHSDIASAPVVAQPALVTNNNEISIYQPIGAAVSASGQTTTGEILHIFWTEGVLDSGSGYGVLKTVQRPVNQVWANSSYGAGPFQVTIPLGDSDVDPPA